VLTHEVDQLGVFAFWGGKQRLEPWRYVGLSAAIMDVLAYNVRDFGIQAIPVGEESEREGFGRIAWGERIPWPVEYKFYSQKG
jgi:hypothetical protein